MKKQGICQVLSRVPGRMRVHLPGWTGQGAEWIRNRLGHLDGVRSVQPNRLTENLLLHFDRGTGVVEALMAELDAASHELAKDQRPTSGRQSSTPLQAAKGYFPLRVVVRGLLGHALVDSLWFGAGFLGSAVGLPLAGLGPLHLLSDIAVWTVALTGEQDRVTPPNENDGGQCRPAGQSIRPA